MHAFLARLIGAGRAGLLLEFARFGTVGFCGFLVDNATVYGLRGAAGLYWAGALAYVTAASTTWALNRNWTYGRGRKAAPGRQWGAFLLVNLIGFTVNRGTYFVLVAWVAAAAAYPVIATFAGTVAGMFLNFHFSRTLVFADQRRAAMSSTLMKKQP
jgi:putative flippase GtrA